MSDLAARLRQLSHDLRGDGYPEEATDDLDLAAEMYAILGMDIVGEQK